MDDSGFNPHTHAGCDHDRYTDLASNRVSIHTPTQGVTGIQCSFLNGSLFQSTHPRRVWLFIPALHPRVGSFNPHTHAGCDQVAAIALRTLAMFQSTHPRRVWRFKTIESILTIEFQSTHPRRVWLFLGTKAVEDNTVSIHTPTQGVTHNEDKPRARLDCFNPHTHAGCDPASSRVLAWSPVSIHTPTQGVTRNRTICSINLRFQSTHPRRVWPVSILDFHCQ